MSPEQNGLAKSVEEQFRAAVKVIQGLPKEGEFQPSNELKLKFYALYKQGTDGPNKTSRPAFYDVVNRYKWDAWSKLGQMSKHDAMRGYVDELKSIVETMGLTHDVSQFYEAVGPIYEFVDLEKEDGGRPETPTDPVPSFSSSPTDLPDLGPNPLQKALMNGSATPIANGVLPNKQQKMMNGHATRVVDVDSDGDEFSDTVDHLSDPASSDPVPVISGDQTDKTQLLNGTTTSDSRLTQSYSSNSVSQAVDREIGTALKELQQSMKQLTGRLDSLERRVARSERSRSSPLPLAGLSPPTVAFILAWPLAVHGAIYLYRQRQLSKKSS